jgi:hypothetical protein
MKLQSESKLIILGVALQIPTLLSSNETLFAIGLSFTIIGVVSLAIIECYSRSKQ